MRPKVVTSVIAPRASSRAAHPAGGSPRRIIARTAASVHRAARTAGFMAATLAVSIACSAVHAQTTSISGSSFSGAQTFDATSGTALINGNATLSANTTFNLGFRINYLVVGGGGGGGGSGGAGGGGGAVLTGSTFLTGVANATVGAGGTYAGNGLPGGSSTLSVSASVITALGGGGGLEDFGSGGASGNGNSGGSNAGGGGGAGSPGQDNNGNGGHGLPWAFGDGTLFGAGGGGVDGFGGNTGGGDGGQVGSMTGKDGTNGYGAGGGGGSPGGSGGSGTVKFVYLGGQTGSATSGTQTVGTGSAAGYTLVSFTSTSAPGSFTLTSAQLANRLAATLTGTLAGSGGLTFAGPGSLTLSGNNLYTGPTTVNGGSLFVNGRVNSAVTVSAASLLGGSGTVAGAVVVGNTGTLSPGNSPGILSFNSLSLSGSAFTLMEIVGSGSTAGVAGTAYDQVAITTANGLSFGGTLDLDLGNRTSLFAQGTTFQLFSFTGTPTGDFTTIRTIDASGSYAGLTFSPSPFVVGEWTTGIIAGSGNQYLMFSENTGQLVALPEPSAVAMAALGAGLTGWQMWRGSRRRRRRAASAGLQRGRTDSSPSDNRRTPRGDDHC